MPSLDSSSDINQYLTAIEDAILGEEVRSAIYNAISQCYNDVTASATVADAAAENAQSVADSLGTVSTQLTNARDAYTNAQRQWQTIYTNSETYISDLEDIKEQTNALKTAASGYESSARAAQTAAEAAQTAAEAARNTAQGYLADFEALDIETVQEDIARLETLDDTYSGYLSDTLTARADAQAAQAAAESARDTANTYREAVNGIYNALNNLNEKFANVDVSALATRMGNLENLETTFAGYNSTFSEYNTTTFPGYVNSCQTAASTASSTYNSAVQAKTSIEGYLETARGILSDIQDLDETIQGYGIEEKLNDLADATEIANNLRDTVQEISDTIDSSNLESLIQQMNSIYNETDAARDEAVASVFDLEDSIAAANTAAESATSKVSELSQLQSSLDILQQNLTYSQGQINTAITNANSIISSATSVVNTARDYNNTAESLITSMTGSIDEWVERRNSIDQYLTDVSNALQSLDGVEDSINNMTVSYESVPYESTSTVSISDVDDHKNIHFAIQQGRPGKSNVIMGDAYDTLSDLQNDITDPEVGDQYNVGTQPPYTIYRWTGTTWEDQGQFTATIDAITNDEIDWMYQGGTSSATGRYLDLKGLSYFVMYKLIPSLLGKVNVEPGKDLSSNDFTQEYIDLINANATSLSNKVDKIQGKGLSSNDFTSTYITAISNNTSAVSNLSGSKLNTRFEDMDELVSTTSLANALFVVRSGLSDTKQTYSVSGSRLISDMISGLRNSDVASLTEAKSYLGISD